MTGPKAIPTLGHRLVVDPDEDAARGELRCVDCDRRGTDVDDFRAPACIDTQVVVTDGGQDERYGYSTLTDTWYRVTEYDDLGGGKIQAKQKEEVPREDVPEEYLDAVTERIDRDLITDGGTDVDGYLRFDHPNVGYVIDGIEDATVRYGLERDIAEGDRIELRTPNDAVFAIATVEDAYRTEVRHAWVDMVHVDDRSHPSTGLVGLLRQLHDHYEEEIRMKDPATVIYFDVEQLGDDRTDEPVAVTDGGYPTTEQELEELKERVSELENVVERELGCLVRPRPLEPQTIECVCEEQFEANLENGLTCPHCGTSCREKGRIVTDGGTDFEELLDSVDVDEQRIIAELDDRADDGGNVDVQERRRRAKAKLDRITDPDDLGSVNRRLDEVLLSYDRFGQARDELRERSLPGIDAADLIDYVDRLEQHGYHGNLDLEPDLRPEDVVFAVALHAGYACGLQDGGTHA